eukprot:4780113-Pyramimonas_sp.AAC.1
MLYPRVIGNPTDMELIDDDPLRGNPRDAGDLSEPARSDRQAAQSGGRRTIATITRTENGKIVAACFVAVGFPVARQIVRVPAPVVLVLAVISVFALLMRGPQRPRHGRLIDRPLPQGGSACGDARLKMSSREKNNIQKVACSALKATRELDWLVSACPQVRCNADWIRVGVSIESGT